MLSLGFINYFSILFKFFLISILIYNADIVLTQNIKHVFKYMNSFRAPQLTQRDGSILFWKVGGNAKADYHQLRLASSLHLSGWAWNSKPFVFFY